MKQLGQMSFVDNQGRKITREDLSSAVTNVIVQSAHDKRIAAVHHHVTRLRGVMIVQAGHESYRVLRRLTQLMDGRAQNL